MPRTTTITPLEPPRRWADRGSAAAYLSVSTRTVDDLIARGTLTVYQLPGGRRVYVDLNEVDAVLAANRRQAGVSA